ncbi:hypothetical protein [Ralstonia pseudosolanacearum]|uniref:hypothetical protein n=1 Tax=Ralstonia pseudosolanacearum TaxID=1310165 RepID=UPI001FFC1F97|nr:hypothetical protein [Ralstonia pseudosolanacearum]
MSPQKLGTNQLRKSKRPRNRDSTAVSTTRTDSLPAMLGRINKKNLHAEIDFGPPKGAEEL